MSDLPEKYTQEMASVEALDPATASVLFQTAEERRSGIDQMMWQVPALSLTGQAFLLQIAYGTGVTWNARLVTAILGFVTAAAAIQLLLKHRYHEEMHSFWLERFAAARGWPILHGPVRPEAFAFEGREHPWKETPELVGWKLARFRSPRVWVGTLALFGLADLVVVAAWLDHLITGAKPFG